MRLKRLIYFLLINMFVSVVTTLAVLTIWDRAHRSEDSEPVSAAPLIAFPTAAPESPPSEPQVSLQPYQVSPGETLGEIALSFGVTVEELLNLNGLTDPHSIGAGETIFVPVSGEAAEDVVTIDHDTPSPVNSGQVEIVAVFGAGDLSSERVQIRGLGEGTLSLTSWLLQDEDGNEYTFPKITLFGSGAVDVYSAAGVDTVVALYWNSGQAIWESGETATLIDRSGNIQATYTVP